MTGTKALLGLFGPVLLLAALAACGGGSKPPIKPTPSATAEPTQEATPPGPTATPSPGGTPSPQPEPTPTPEQPFEGGRDPVSGTGAQGALLVQVRYGRHAEFDRIVFQFEEGLPGYAVKYVQPPVLGEFSGLPVEVAGAAYLRVNFAAAGHDEDGASTYLGPRELKPALDSLLEAEETGDFENALTWVLGLQGPVDFRVYALAGPFRVVVDVGHPE